MYILISQCTANIFAFENQWSLGAYEKSYMLIFILTIFGLYISSCRPQILSGTIFFVIKELAFTFFVNKICW